jgi:leader peptidase (prepilin peptidase)/N-methyltransferase
MITLLLVIGAGWIAGGIVNYFSDVLPYHRSLTRPFCHSCGVTQNWSHYLFWPWQCLQCGARRPVRTFIIEGFFVLAAIYMWKIKFDGLSFFPGLFLAIFLGVVVVIDVEHRLILHQVSLVGFVIGSTYGFMLHGLKSTLLGGLVGFVGMLIFYILGIGFVHLLRLMGRPTDEVALGFGDVNLSGIIGLLLGSPGINAGLLITLLLSGFISLIYMLIMLIRKQYRPDLALPFGPFLIGSVVILLYLKETIYWVWSLL